MKFFRNLVKSLPSLLTALLFAIAVWIFAVTEADPTETRTLPQSYSMDIIGLDPALMAVNDITEQVALTLRAPSTILDRLQNESAGQHRPFACGNPPDQSVFYFCET